MSTLSHRTPDPKNPSTTPTASSGTPYKPEQLRIFHVDLVRDLAEDVARLSNFVDTLALSAGEPETEADARKVLGNLTSTIGVMLHPGHPWQREALQRGIVEQEASGDTTPAPSSAARSTAKPAKPTLNELRDEQAERWEDLTEALTGALVAMRPFTYHTDKKHTFEEQLHASMKMQEAVHEAIEQAALFRALSSDIEGRLEGGAR